MKTALIIGLMLCYQEGIAQDSGIIRSTEQNLRWLDSLSRQPVKKQIDMLAERLIADTGIIVPKSRPLLSGKDLRRYMTEDSIRNIGKVTGIPSPLIIIENRPLNSSHLSPSATEIQQWYQVLIQRNFKSVSTKRPNAQIAALYGTRGSIGVIFIDCK